MKKLKVQFIRNKNVLGFCVKEQEGLPEEKEKGIVNIVSSVEIKLDEIYLRGRCKLFDNLINSRLLESETEAKEKIDFFINAITEELFPSTQKTVEDLKEGDMCLVRDYEDDEWQEREFLCEIKDKKIIYKYICRNEMLGFMTNCWRYVKKINPEVKFSKDVQIVHGTEITTCTWEEVE